MTNAARIEGEAPTALLAEGATQAPVIEANPDKEHRHSIEDPVSMTTFREYLTAVRSDAYRYTGDEAFWPNLKRLLLTPGLKYTFLIRSACYFKIKGLWGLPAYGVIRVLLHRYTYKYGISIPYNASIGPGLYIGHFGGIVVNWQARLGRNCNINHEVTIGASYGGKFPGVPIIGDNVYVGPGSKVVGGIRVGHNVAIGANAVVVEPVPDNAVVAGVPARILSFKGSSGYVINRWKNCPDPSTTTEPRRQEPYCR